MNAKYLLPCSCGEKIPVEPRQAGQTITCACGASLEVPAMLQIKRLQRAEPEPEEVERRETARQGWGALEGLTLLGVVILLSATGVGTWLFVIRPKPDTLPPPETIRESVNALPPQALWRNWHTMRAKGLDPMPPRQNPDYPVWCFRYRLWMGTVAVIGVLGLVLTVTMVSLRNRIASARPPSISEETG